MKKIITGGFLSLIGTLGIIGIYLLASQQLVTSWYHSRYLTTIFQPGGLTTEFVLSAGMLLAGLVLMLVGCCEKSPSAHKDS